jgi:hypothetical protein
MTKAIIHLITLGFRLVFNRFGLWVYSGICCKKQLWHNCSDGYNTIIAIPAKPAIVLQKVGMVVILYPTLVKLWRSQLKAQR